MTDLDRRVTAIERHLSRLPPRGGTQPTLIVICGGLPDVLHATAGELRFVCAPDEPFGRVQGQGVGRRGRSRRTICGHRRVAAELASDRNDSSTCRSIEAELFLRHRQHCLGAQVHCVEKPRFLARAADKLNSSANFSVKDSTLWLSSVGVSSLRSSVWSSKNFGYGRSNCNAVWCNSANRGIYRAKSGTESPLAALADGLTGTKFQSKSCATKVQGRKWSS